ncbi:MAG: sigma-70 family RNA polymerase sigma factor [Gemmataceae bacterium]
MAAQARAVLGRIIRSAARAADAALTDRELLRRYAHEGDEAAFAALVQRHTALVLGVCRRVLPTVQDAEDATQATFLVLARKAQSTRWQPSVANWLYVTARRLADRARLAATRRAKREAVAAAARAVEPVDAMTGRELLAALDEELDRLPATYREPLVLCYLEGLSRDEAASRLRIPAGTVKIRLERGRKKLGDALVKRGVVVGASLLALAATSPAGASPLRIVEAVLDATAGHASPAVIALAEGVAVNKSLWIVGTLAAVATLCIGVGVVRSAAGQPPEKMTPGKPTARAKAMPGGEAKKDATVNGRVFAPDGKLLAGARLLLLDTGAAAVELGTSDADGRFAVRVPAGTKSPAIAAVAEGVGIDFIALNTVTAGATVELRTVKDRAIRGRVVDTQGKPFAGAVVTVQHIAVYPRESLEAYLDEWPSPSVLSVLPVPKQMQWERAHFTATATDTDGRFALAGVGAERFVALRISGAGIATDEAFVFNSAGFDPRKYNEAAAQRDLKRVNGRVNRPKLNPPDPVLVVERDKPIRGVVRDADTGAPRPGVTVEMSINDRPYWLYRQTARTDAAGRYEFRGSRKSERYLVYVRCDPAAGYLGGITHPLDTPAYEPVVADFSVKKGVVVTGRVTDGTTGAPVPNLATSAALAGNLFMNDYTAVSLGLFEPSTGDDGRYRIVTIPGPVLLEVSPSEAPPGVHYESTLGDPDYPEYFDRGKRTFKHWMGRDSKIRGPYCKVLIVPQVAAVVTHDVVLKRAASVPLKVVDGAGKPLTGVRVVGATLDNMPALVATDPAGVYQLRRGSPRLLTAYEPTRKLVGALALKGDEAGPLTLTLGAGGVVTGRLLADDGTPLKGYGVRPKYAADEGMVVEAMIARSATDETNAAGTFRLAAVLPGVPFDLYFFDNNGRSLPQSPRPGLVTGADPAKPLDLGEIRVQPPS